MIFLRSVKGFGIFETLKRLRFKLLRLGPEQILVRASFFDVIIRLEELMALQALDIYLSDPGWRI